MIFKEQIQELMKKPGQVRGVVFDTDRKYVLRKWGQEGLKKLNSLVKEYDDIIEYGAIEAMDWYPAPLRTVSLLLIKQCFDLKDEHIREMGKKAPTFSVVVRLFFKLFGSVEKLAKEIPAFWKKHWTIGTLKPKNIKEHEITIILEGIDFHPIYCIYLEGYFETIMAMTRPKGSKVEVKEISCPFKGHEANSHEYLFKWTL